MLLLLSGSSLWPVGGCAFLFVLQEVVLVLAGRLASPSLVRLVPRLGFLARVSLLLVAFIALARLVTHGPMVMHGPMSSSDPSFWVMAMGISGPLPPSDDRKFDPVDERLGAALAFSYALRNTTRVEPRLVLNDGTLSVILPDATTLELPAQTLPDQRLAMVIVRLFKNDKGRPLFGFKEISAAFGKNNRQDSQNHMRQFTNAGGSLVQMILRGIAGRPRALSPEMERRIASFWERDPIATPEQCHQWLAAQSLPPGTELPSIERLAKLRYIPGNLVTVRHSMARLFARSDALTTLRRDTRFCRKDWHCDVCVLYNAIDLC